MPLPRPRTSAFVVALTLALAACGAARPTSTLVGTSAVGAPATGAPTTSPTTAPTTATAAPTGPSVATTVTPATTTPADGAPTTVPAPGTTAAPVTPAPPAPTGTALTPTARVARMFTLLGYPVTDDEAACLTREISPEALTALEQGGEPALVGSVTSSFVMALSRCEPLTFLQEQDQITIEDYGATPTEARCVTNALDAAARNDPAVALAYYEGTTKLPADGQQRLIDALTPCVGAARAREIITT